LTPTFESAVIQSTTPLHISMLRIAKLEIKPTSEFTVRRFIRAMLSQLYPACALAVIVSWSLVYVFQRLRSPLARVPGPRHTLFSPLWLIYQEFTYSRRPFIHQLHGQYGPVVRVGPNEVSFTSLEALKEIYTSGGSGYDKTELYTLFMQFNTRSVSSDKMR